MLILYSHADNVIPGSIQSYSERDLGPWPIALSFYDSHNYGSSGRGKKTAREIPISMM